MFMKGYAEEKGFSNIMVKERHSKSPEHLNAVIPAKAGIHLPHIGLLMCKVELRSCLKKGSFKRETGFFRS
jgi:hypothetical protein